MIYHFTKIINITKLQDELLNNGVVFKNYITADLIDDNGITEKAECVFADDTDINLAQGIIDNHNPTPLPRPLTEIEQLRLETARANTELFEMMLMMNGGA